MFTIECVLNVFVCLQEGRTYVGRDDATNEQDISEFFFVDRFLSSVYFSYCLFIMNYYLDENIITYNLWGMSGN